MHSDATRCVELAIINVVDVAVVVVVAVRLDTTYAIYTAATATQQRIDSGQQRQANDDDDLCVSCVVRDSIFILDTHYALCALGRR